MVAALALIAALSAPNGARAADTPDCDTFDVVVRLRRDVNFANSQLGALSLHPELRVFFMRRIADAKRAMDRVVAMWKGPNSPTREMLMAVLSLKTEFRAYTRALPLYASLGATSDSVEERRSALRTASESIQVKVIHHENTDVYFPPDRLQRVLRRHHPAFFDPAELEKVASFQTFFPAEMSPDDLVEIASAVVRDRVRDIFRFLRNRTEPTGEPIPDTMPFASTVGGRTYTLVLDREAKLVTLYPHENPT